MTNVAVIVPTIREDCITRFLSEWFYDLRNAQVIIVEDNPTKTFDIKGYEHYAWDSIEQDLESCSWIVPRRTSAVRSYGIWQAWRGGADIIWTLDDDCYPEVAQRGCYLTKILKILSTLAPQDSWWNTLPEKLSMYPRGYPYEIRDRDRPVMVHHGLWSNVPDLDGVTQKAYPDFRLAPAEGTSIVPAGVFFPMCIMNLAFKAEMAPAMYMLLMGKHRSGESWGFDRFDDMWAGLFVKKISDHLGYAISSGGPSIHHSRASNVENNIRLEASGIKAHEKFWPFIRDLHLTGKTVTDCYLEIADEVAHFNNESYWVHLSMAMRHWAELFI